MPDTGNLTLKTLFDVGTYPGVLCFLHVCWVDWPVNALLLSATSYPHFTHSAMNNLFG